MARSPAELVAALAADPRHGAVVCDIDGTLAPIAATPEQARVLPGALVELERLAGTYVLVACITGHLDCTPKELWVGFSENATGRHHGGEHGTRNA